MASLTMGTFGRPPTDEEWLIMKPTIEYLYLANHKPLYKVKEILEEHHGFRASIAMYKRRLQVWGYRKNRQQKSGKLPITKPHQQRAIRYLMQNEVDESLHTLFDLIDPYITHGYLLWRSSDVTKNVYCPSPAAYTYNDFTCNIALATAAFGDGNIARGGEMLRRAFLDLEQTLKPQRRSIFTLHTLFFAVGTLVQAKMFDATRMLLAHVADFVIGPAHGESIQGRSTLETGIGHADHPFPQIVLRLKALSLKLRHDDLEMKSVYLRGFLEHYCESP
ncbi:hypothetical protein GQ53DRAFT_839178 [Thozetella sp. PMI_491]|nr:hypothetical protein GQ53DRAFT_839178 [Thozetella sp. PMI_491]